MAGPLGPSPGSGSARPAFEAKINHFLPVNVRMKFDVLKTNVCQRSEASLEGKYASFI